jgi:hypothetical protein
MTAKVDLADWLKQDLEDAAREVENWPEWMKQVNALCERPLELSQEAQRARRMADLNEQQPTFVSHK